MTDAESASQKSGTTLPASLSASLPAGSTIQQIAFVSERTAGQTIVWEAPLSLQRRAVLVSSLPQSPSGGGVNLTLLTVPAPVGEAATEAESELFSTMRQWVDATASPDSPPSQVMMFQGTQLCWTAERVALLIPADRLESVRRVLIEAAFYEQELLRIERTLGERWPQLEADMPLAFEFEASSQSQQTQLRQRCGQVLLLRAGLARLGPYVHSPHLHPPTLASQMGERLRDRTRMEHRYEFLDEQIEVFEEVYEICGQRASDYKLARTGHILEWIIILFLFAQFLLYGFEILTNVGQ